MLYTKKESSARPQALGGKVGSGGCSPTCPLSACGCAHTQRCHKAFKTEHVLVRVEGGFTYTCMEFSFF